MMNATTVNVRLAEPDLAAIVPIVTTNSSRQGA